MVGKRHKNRIEIEDADAELLQIGQFFTNPIEIAAEKVLVPNRSVLIGAVFGRFIPILMDRIGAELVCQIAVAALAEAVGHDLIHDSAARVIGHGEVGRDHAELPLLPCLHIGVISLLEQAEAAVLLCDIKPIKIQAALGKGKLAAVDSVVVLLLLQNEGLLHDRCTVAVFQHQAHAGRAAAAWYKNVQNAVFPRSERAERGFVLRCFTVEQNPHGITSDSKYFRHIPRPRGRRRRCPPWQY